MLANAFPLDDTGYLAEDLRKWFFSRTSGVYSKDDNLRVSLLDYHSVVVEPGIAYLNDGMGGIVVWINERRVFVLKDHDKMYDRWDTIVLRWNKRENKPEIDLVNGEQGELMTPPQRDAEAYEIIISKVFVKKGIEIIETKDIFDTRLDESVCGLMRDGVTGIPSKELYDQFNASTAEIINVIEEWYSNVQKSVAAKELLMNKHIETMTEKEKDVDEKMQDLDIAVSSGAFDGSYWLSGNGVPGNKIGRDRDWYIDLYTDRWKVYRKDGDVWTDTGSNLRGENGSMGGDTVPIGAMVSWHAGALLSDEWLVCNGSAISRTTYSELFSVIGTTYGAGNGTTTFNLPNEPSPVSYSQVSSGVIQFKDHEPLLKVIIKAKINRIEVA